MSVCYLFISPRPEAGKQHSTRASLAEQLRPWVLVPSTGTGTGTQIKSTQCPQVCFNGSGHALARVPPAAFQILFWSLSIFLLSISWTRGYSTRRLSLFPNFTIQWTILLCFSQMLCSSLLKNLDKVLGECSSNCVMVPNGFKENKNMVRVIYLCSSSDPPRWESCFWLPQDKMIL